MIHHRLKADEISKLVELSNSLVKEKTGRHLEPVQNEILRQLLMGKRNNDIEVFNSEGKKLTKHYIRGHYIPNLLSSLSFGLGRKVNKRNLLKTLQTKLRVNHSQIAIEQTERDGQVAQNGSLSTPEVSYDINSNSTNYRNSHHLNSSQECRNRFRGNGQVGNSPQADQTQSKKLSDDSPAPTAQEFQSSNYTSAHENSDRSKSNTDGWSTLMHVIKPGVPLLLSIGALSCSFGLSWLANWYGLMNHLNGQLPQAQRGYEIALKLNPSSPEAHYNQGVAYEDQQNYQGAHDEYQLAIKGGLLEAYNNQARLYVLQGNYDAAVSLLRIALPLTEDDRVKADMYKNRGWARLEQGHLALASIDLKEAIKLKSNRAPAYCLMAQVLEREGNEQEAEDYWFKCLEFSRQPQTPEQDKWVELASQRLTPKEGEQ